MKNAVRLNTLKYKNAEDSAYLKELYAPNTGKRNTRNKLKSSVRTRAILMKMKTKKG